VAARFQSGIACRRSNRKNIMSLVSTSASILLAALPEPVRHPSPRKSEAAREFDALLADLARNEPSPGKSLGVMVTRKPWGGPVRADARRARH
jgi:hypothetical protein